MYRLRINLWVTIPGDLFGNKTMFFAGHTLTFEQFSWVQDNYPKTWENFVERIDG